MVPMNPCADSVVRLRLVVLGLLDAGKAQTALVRDVLDFFEQIENGLVAVGRHADALPSFESDLQ